MELPLFPLHVVLLPGGTLPLHIFEPRYRAMMETVLVTDRSFGIVAIRHGMEAGAAEIHDVGTIAAVEQVKRAPDGTMDILVAGRKRFRVDMRLPDDPFPRAAVTPVDLEDAGEDAGDLLTPARAAVHRYLSVVAQIQGSEVRAPAVPPDLVGASFVLADALAIDLPERQRLLACGTAAARLALTIELARREAALLEAVGPSVGRPSGAYSPN